MLSEPRSLHVYLVRVRVIACPFVLILGEFVDCIMGLGSKLVAVVFGRMCV